MKKIIRGSIIVGIIMIVSGLIYGYLNQSQSKEKSSPQGFQLVNSKKVEMCQGECELEDTEFATLKLDTSIKEVTEKIDEINSETKTYYEIANSAINSIPECAEASNRYKHQYYILTNYQLYQNDEIISIAVNRTKRNVCNSTYETLPYSIIVYDKENKIELTQQDILNKAGYTEETVNQLILNYIENNNNSSDYKINIENVFTDGLATYSLYYNEQGQIILAFQIRNEQTFNYQEIILGN